MRSVVLFKWQAVSGESIVVQMREIKLSFRHVRNDKSVPLKYLHLLGKRFGRFREGDFFRDWDEESLREVTFHSPKNK